MLKWTISLTIIAGIGYFVIIPLIVSFKNEGFQILIDKIKFRKDIKKYVPEEIYHKLPEQIKQLKVSKKWEQVLNLGNLIKENQGDVTKFGTGLYMIGKKTFDHLKAPNTPLNELMSSFYGNLDEFPNITGPLDPKLVKSILNELEKLDYEKIKRS